MVRIAGTAPPETGRNCQQEAKKRRAAGAAAPILDNQVDLVAETGQAIAPLLAELLTRMPEWTQASERLNDVALKRAQDAEDERDAAIAERGAAVEQAEQAEQDRDAAIERAAQDRAARARADNAAAEARKSQQQAWAEVGLVRERAKGRRNRL